MAFRRAWNCMASTPSTSAWVQANYTYNDTNLASIVLDGEEIGSSPLVGSAKNQANVTVFYENDKFLARASYNRRGEVVGGLNNGMTTYTKPYSQLDLNVAYNLTPDWTVTAAVLNATKSGAAQLHRQRQPGPPAVQPVRRPPAVFRRELEVLRRRRACPARSPRSGGRVLHGSHAGTGGCRFSWMHVHGPLGRRSVRRLTLPSLKVHTGPTPMASKEPQMEFHVDGMTCGGCARSVTRAIQQIDPNARVVADPPSGLVRCRPPRRRNRCSPR